MKQSQDITENKRRFRAPAPVNATDDGNAAPWTGRHWHLAEQVESFCNPNKITGPVVPGKNDHLTIRNDIRGGLLRRDKEGQDWRFVTFKIWRDIENEVLSNQTPGAKNLNGLQDIKRFDRSVLPHLAKNISPDEKCAFIESAILHLAWVAHEGINSKVHLDVIRHSLNLLKKSLPEALDQAPAEHSFNKRLELILSQVIRRAIEVPANELKESAWELATDVARLKLPNGQVNLFEATGELLLDLQDSRDDYSEREPNQYYLSAYDKEGWLKVTQSQDDSAPTSYQDEMNDDESEEWNQSEDGLRRSFFRRSSRRRYIDEDGTPYELLGRKLIEAMLSFPRTEHSFFWIRFLDQTSMTDPFWASGMRGLEQSNQYEFQYFTRRLIIASSQTEVAALNLMKVAALAEQSKWQQNLNFPDLVTEVAETVSQRTKLRASENLFSEYYKLSRAEQHKLRHAKTQLFVILTTENESTSE
jgi:hypothetical protein